MEWKKRVKIDFGGIHAVYVPHDLLASRTHEARFVSHTHTHTSDIALLVGCSTPLL